MGVQGTEGAGPGLHPGGRGVPAAAQGGEYVHGVVARAEEDPAPQVGHPVAVPLLDAHEAAALADVLQFLVPDRVLHGGGQPRQHGEREQGLQGAGGRQPAVGVARGQHLAGAGVGDQPGQRGDVRQLGRTAVRSDLGAGAVEQGRLRHRRPRPGRCGIPRAVCGGGGGRREGQHARDAQGAGRRHRPTRESGDHMINVGSGGSPGALPGPDGPPEHPDAAFRDVLRPWAGSAGRGAGRLRCRGCPAAAPAGSPDWPARRPGSAAPGAGPEWPSTRPG